MRIVTVGAGPCGLYASRLMQEGGHEVVVLEEHEEVGRPVNCAGLVGSRFVERFGDKHVMNRIDGAHIHLGSSHFSLRRDNVAYVLDRCAFDKSLASGLDIGLGIRVRHASAISGGYRVEHSDGSFDCDALIGADGPSSIVRRDLWQESDISIYPAYQERVEHDVAETHMVTVDVRRPFFSWIIPEGNGIVRVGTIGARKGLESIKERFGVNGEPISRIRAPIPVGRVPLSRGMSFLVGDAAAQTKPLTGGGLFYGLRAATMLAQALEDKDPSLYQSLWDKRYGKEISTALKARKVYENMSESDLKKAFDVLSDNRERIEAGADFEKHSKAIGLLLRNPSLIAILGRNFMNLI